MYILKGHPNWRSATQTLPSLSTFLGGFSLTLMVLTLRADTKSIDFYLFGRVIPSHILGLVLLAVAALLFIYAIQCLLRAQSHDYFDIERELVKRMEAEAKELGGDIEQYIVQMNSRCRTWYLRGARLFDFALLFLFGGAAVLVYPYAIFVTVLFSLGIIVEILWLVSER